MKVRQQLAAINPYSAVNWQTGLQVKGWLDGEAKVSSFGVVLVLPSNPINLLLLGSIEQACNMVRNCGRCGSKRLIDMDVSLGDPP